MAKEIQIVIKDGVVRFIHNDDLAETLVPALGTAKTRRASHVEPAADGSWTADLTPVNGPVLGPFQRRDEALAAEVEYIQRNNTPIPATA
jgi:hypothetical protein